MLQFIKRNWRYYIVYKTDYSDVQNYYLLNTTQRQLFDEVWENISDWAYFNSMTTLKPVKAQMVRQVKYKTVNPAGEVINEKDCYFNLTDMNEYLNTLKQIEAMQKLLGTLEYEYIADIDTSEKYLQIQAEQDGYIRTFKVFDADRWQ